MKVQRFGYKFYLAPSSSLEIRDLITVFHGWIQQQQVEEHLLVDVHDYSHVFQGPGVLLVAHEGNFCLDSDQGRPGLLYYRKEPLNGEPLERLEAVFRSTVQACRMLEQEVTLEGSVRFRTDELLFLTNDRLNAPNSRETYSDVRPALSGFADQVLGSGCGFEPRFDPRERFAVRFRLPEAVPLEDLIRRVD